jgi:hypothetical protein
VKTLIKQSLVVFNKSRWKFNIFQC